MKRKRYLALVMAAVMAGGLLAGCGSSGGDSSTGDNSEQGGSDEAKDVTLTVWGPQEDQAPLGEYEEGILKAMCEAFDEAHPEWNITFEYGVCGEGDARDQVTKDVEEAADVYMFANDQIPKLVEAGALGKAGRRYRDLGEREQ